MPIGAWSKQQIAIPIIRSKTTNTGVVVLVIGNTGTTRSDSSIVYTLFNSKGKEYNRLVDEDFERYHRARFIDEIFTNMPEEFVGTLRVSIDRTVDDPLRVTEQEWEEHRKYLKTLNRWITGAALRIDYTEDGINLGSTPVRSGLIHLIKREE